MFVDDDTVRTQMIGMEETLDAKQIPANAGSAEPLWKPVTLDLSKYAGKTVALRLYHWLAADQPPVAAYRRSVRIE